VLDNLLCAHVLAARAHRRAPTVSGGGMSTRGCSRSMTSTRICLDLLAAPTRGRDGRPRTTWIALPPAGVSRPHSRGRLAPVRPPRLAAVPGVGTLALRATGGRASGGSGGPRGGSSASSAESGAARRLTISWPSSIPARSLRATRPPPSRRRRGAGISPTRSPSVAIPREGRRWRAGCTTGRPSGSRSEPARGHRRRPRGARAGEARRRAHRVLLLPLAGRRVRLRQLRAAHRPLRHGPRPWAPRHPLARDRQRRRRRRRRLRQAHRVRPGAGRAG